MKRTLAILLIMAILMTSTTAFAEPLLMAASVDLKDVGEIIEDIDILSNNVGTQDTRLKRNLDFNRAVDVLNYIIRRIELKAQFTQNTREIWNLKKEIDHTMKQITRELKDIRKSDRELNAEQFYQIKQIKEDVKQDIREAEYRIGNITKETVVFIKAVKNREFKKAQDTFGNILALQKQQIEFLETILKNTMNLLEVLQSIA